MSVSVTRCRVGRSPFSLIPPPASRWSWTPNLARLRVRSRLEHCGQQQGRDPAQGHRPPAEAPVRGEGGGGEADRRTREPISERRPAWVLRRPAEPDPGEGQRRGEGEGGGAEREYGDDHGD